MCRKQNKNISTQYMYSFLYDTYLFSVDFSLALKLHNMLTIIHLKLSGLKFKKIDKRKWHKKFAWTPTYVQDSETENTYVWLEKYMRRANGSVWHKYSHKEWFRKKLAGDFETKEKDTDVYIGGTATVSSTITAGGGLQTPAPTYSFTVDKDSGFVSGVTIETTEVSNDVQLELDLGEEDFTTESYVTYPMERPYDKQA